MELEERLAAIVKILDENKAEHIEVFNLEGSEYMANGVVLATAMADRHLLALLDYLKQDLKPKGEEFLHVDTSDEWVAIDLGDILVHVMTESARNKYHMEAFLQEFEKKKQARG